MSRLICKFQVVGPVQTNCYFLYREDTKDCVIVDPGDEAKRIKKFIEDQELHPVAILLTHGHFDHVMAVDSVRAAYHIPVYAAEAEKETMHDASINLSINMGGAMLSIEADPWLKDGETITLLDQEVRCILAPGHTVGGMCFYFPKAGMLFSEIHFSRNRSAGLIFREEVCQRSCGRSVKNYLFFRMPCRCIRGMDL